MRFILTFCLMGVITVSGSPPPELSAKVVAIKKYENGRVVDFDRRVPIYDGRPVYDITIQVGDKPYIVRYESGTGYYPAAWAEGKEIRVKKDDGRFLLMNRDEEVPADIVSGSDCTPQPAHYSAIPQLPC